MEPQLQMSLIQDMIHFLQGDNFLNTSFRREESSYDHTGEEYFNDVLMGI